MTFRFRPVLALAVLVALGILISLGTWQLQRRTWKLELIANIEARTQSAPIALVDAISRAAAGENMEYTPVFVDGAFSSGKANVFGTYAGTPGRFVFSPMTPVGGDVVYVNRGFVRQGEKEATAPSSNLRIVGLLRYPEQASGVAGGVKLTTQSTDGLWHIRDPQRFADAAGAPVIPYYIDAFAAPDNGAQIDAEWPKGGTTRLEFRNRHMEYALTWFGLAGSLLGVFLFYSLKREA